MVKNAKVIPVQLPNGFIALHGLIRQKTITSSRPVWKPENVRGICLCGSLVWVYEVALNHKISYKLITLYLQVPYI
jgi:hypothetical protein